MDDSVVITSPRLVSIDDEDTRMLPARTDIVKVQGDITSLITKLCNSIDGKAHINYVFKSVKQDKSISMEALGKIYHNEIKAFIADQLDVPKNTPLVYSSKLTRNSYFALFLSNKPTDLSRIHEDAETCNINDFWLANHLIDLHIKSYLINKPTIFGKHTIGQFNSEMLLGAQSTNYEAKSGRGTPGTIHDLLKINVWLSPEMEFNINLIKQVYFTPHNGEPIGNSVLKDESLFFIGQKAQSSSTRKWDARKSQRNFMGFDAPASTTRELAKNPMALFSNSIAYYITYLQNCVIEIFSSLSVSSTPIIFSATHRIDVQDIDCLSSLANITVIDARTRPNKAEDTVILQFQKDNSADYVRAGDISNVGSLDRERAYIVVNDNANDGTTITDSTGKVYNSFISAVIASKKIPTTKFDFYTDLKLYNFESNNKIISQGVDGASKLKSAQTIERLHNELIIKKVCFQGKSFSLETDVCSNYSLISIRRNSDYVTFASVTCVTIKDNTVTINNQKIYSSKNFIDKIEFNNRYESLKYLLPNAPSDVLSDLYNDSFIIIDKESKESLVSYHSTRVPNVIGNANFDNINLWHSRKEGEATPFTQSALPEKCVLPYYASRSKDFNSIFISDHGTYVDYFITPHQPVNSTVNKRNLTKRILVVDLKGQHRPVLKTKVALLYFDSHCSKFIKNKAVAYKTLLQKVSEAPFL
ncbi:hypothetical protein A9Q75_01575 [Colwellia psychrerythraea]|uniref:Uncharacterized protein n=1 Tax=Colwellia psychrerythraea TaxID=28229 RepID=A0A1Y5EQK6_COLPS|nr:hypothetical protein A9Q75_01575 [Colwellia psychrerythraea]